MGRQVLVSDLHMNYWSPTVRTAFLDFLASDIVQGAERFLINGDILDVPAAAPDNILPQHAEVLQALWQLSRHTSVTYLIGNHDEGVAHLGRVFAEGEAIQIVPDAELFVSGSQRVFITHGQQYDPLTTFHVYDVLAEIKSVTGIDVGIEVEKWYRDIVGDRPKTQAFSEGERGQAYARASGGPGQPVAQPPLVGIPPFLNEIWQLAAEMEAMRQQAAWVIFGHTHHPEVLPLRHGGTYVNSGDWVTNQTYVVIEDGQVVEYDWRTQPTP